MKVSLISIGRTRDEAMASAIERYVKRLRHYIPFDYVTLGDVKTTRAMTEERQKEAEGRLFIDRKTVTLPRNLVFLIGGPYGFSPEIYERADDKLSLSRMTFPHEMVRLFFVEQVYRAMTILRGEPYHHD